MPRIKIDPLPLQETLRAFAAKNVVGGSAQFNPAEYTLTKSNNWGSGTRDDGTETRSDLTG